MQTKGVLRIALLALMVLVLQVTWALAGTTGNIDGTVRDQNGNPVAGAKVTIISPSQSATITASTTGFYSALNLSPDTYAVTATKEGYDPATVYGITVQADQTSRADIVLRPPAKILGRVTTTATTSVVSRTVTGDLYSVSAQAINSYQGSSGGSENLYSQSGIVGSLPGVVRAVGGGGAYNGQGTLSFRGGAFDQVGYELDGIPLNRGFDFYNSTSFLTNGLASLEVYTGGEPADAGRAMSGYINQVIRRGSYPGGGDVTGLMGTPLFNHTVNADVYGGTPNNRFTYFVSTLAVNANYNWGDKQNLDNSSINVPANDPGCPSVNATINFLNQDLYGSANPFINCAVPNTFNVPISQSVWLNGSTLNSAQRDTVANLHWGFEHNGLTDDLQLLFSTGVTGGQFPYSGSTIDPGLVSENIAIAPPGGPFLGPGCSRDANPTAGCQTILWPTGNVYPLGSIGTPYNPALLQELTWPSSGGSVAGVIPSNYVDSQSTRYSIEKVGYTHSLSQSSFLRVFGYAMYSFWGLDQATNGDIGGTYYQLHDNATGVTLNYQNQLNQHNLLKIDVDYSRDLTLRDNYGNYFPMSRLFDYEKSRFVRCGTITGGAATIHSCAPGDPLAFRRGPYSYLSTTTPIFSDVVLADSFKPSDKLLFDVGVRFDRFVYQLMPLQITGPNGLAEQAQNQAGICLHGFNYAPAEPCFGYLNSIANQTTGVSTGRPQPLRPDLAPGMANWTDVSGNLTYNATSPRFGFTYSASPRDVVRFSVGRYVQPPNSAFVEYKSQNVWGPGNTVGALNRFYDGLGFLAVHHIQPEDSTNYDLSYEHDFNSGASFKLTPFYRTTRNQILNLPVNPAQPSFVTGYNFGNARIKGLEFLLRQNRQHENGLSGTLALTVTDGKVRFNKGPNGSSYIDTVNTVIAGYNAKYGTNFSMLDSTASYYPSFTQAGTTTLPSYIVPVVANLNLDYRTNGFDISPTFNFQSGNPYGDPLNFGDPHCLADPVNTCLNNGPNPYTGKFDAPGSQLGPSWVTMNLGVSHSVGHNLIASVLETNLFTHVHNRGYPWEFPTSKQVIAYGDNFFYNGFASSLGFTGDGPPHDTIAYYGNNYYPYAPNAISPLRTFIFSVSAKL